MKKLIFLVFILVFIYLNYVNAYGEYFKGEILVKFNDNVSEDEATSLINSFGLKTTGFTFNIATVMVPVGEEERWIKKFEDENIVKDGSFNFIYGADPVTEDDEQDEIVELPPIETTCLANCQCDENGNIESCSSSSTPGGGSGGVGSGYQQSYCKDSDGRNPYVAGEVEAREEGRTYEEKYEYDKEGNLVEVRQAILGGIYDYCDIEKNLLYEGLCDNGKAVHAKIECPADAPYCNSGKCSSITPSCKDSDNGVNPSKKGDVKEERIKGDSRNIDYCENIETKKYLGSCNGNECGLREFYCSDNALFYGDIPCPSGCEDGVCEGFNEKEPVLEEEVKPVNPKKPIGNIETPKKTECNGCLDGDKCVPISVRIDNVYCDIDFELKGQKLERVSCNNNYECQSNLCVNNSCVEGNLIEKISNWFKKVFG